MLLCCYCTLTRYIKEDEEIKAVMLQKSEFILGSLVILIYTSGVLYIYVFFSDDHTSLLSLQILSER